MDEITNKINTIFSRHIAKTLSFIEAAKMPIELKYAIKSEFWYTCQDILSLLNESHERRKKNERPK